MLTSARRPKFRSAASSGLLVASLLLGACSKNNVAASSTSTPPTVTTAITDPAGYVANICASGATWQRALQQRVSDFTTAQTGVTDLNVARQNLVDYLNGLAADTDTFVTAVEAAGSPPVKNGDSVEVGLLLGLRSVAQAFRDDATQVRSLPTSDAAAFTAGLSRLGAAIGKQLKAAGKSLRASAGPVLDPLIRANTDCTPPRSGP